MEKSIMDCSLLNAEILKQIKTIKSTVSSSKSMSAVESDGRFMGYIPTNMEFKDHKMQEIFQNEPIIEKNSETRITDVSKSTKKDSLSLPGNEILTKKSNTQEIKPKLNIYTDINGKKFIYLKGQKLKVIQHSPNIIQSKNDKTSETISQLVPLTKIKTSPPIIRLESDKSPPSCKSASTLGTSIQRVMTIPTRITTRPILPKMTGKIISINKTEGFQNLSVIMKEVGGTIRLSPGIPLPRHTDGSVPTRVNVITDSSGTMESKCACGKKNLVDTSSNTEQVSTVDKEVQTDSHNECNSVENQCDSPLSELYNGGVIIGDDVNMGHGPPALYKVKEQNMKMKFFHDLQRCMKWESGNLPIHRGVIEENLQEVKSQCIVLKARKAGINIPNINSLTPLQLSVINSVKIEVIKVLLDYDADLSVLDSDGNNVLHLAVEHNRLDLMELFLKKVTPNSDLNINHFNYDGLTPLMMCAFHKDRIDMAERLLRNDASLNLRDLKSGRTAIFHAAESHNAPLVALLLDYGADTKIRNFFGTSVHEAMFELEEIPKEIKYPILGRDLKIHEKRKLHQQSVNKENFKRKKLEIVPTIQKLESKAVFVINTSNYKE